MTTENKKLTAQWTAVQDQVAQAEARLANLKAQRETLEGELYKLLGKDGFQAFYHGWLRGAPTRPVPRAESEAA
jgi:outer membrane protein TolC